MTTVLAISIGPVQDMIAAARRTADLQAGSDILVQMARAAATTLQAQGAELVFPSDPAKDGPNKVVAVLNGQDPSALATAARAAAQAVLDTEWKRLLGRVPQWVERRDIASDQVANLLECYAAWATADGYEEARRQADRNLAGRKALRNFAPPLSAAGRPKSSLDPSRDCVTPEIPPDRGDQNRKGIRLGANERLDALSLVKRQMGADAADAGDRAVPSTTEMAFRGVQPVLEAQDDATLASLVDRVQRLGAPGLCLGDFAFEGRLQEAIEEGLVKAVEGEPIQRSLMELCKAAEISEIQPYFAILHADGDRMGARISELGTADAHRGFSAKLAGFAAEADKVVQAHNGHLVYAGGDDVLALLPVPKALACGKALADRFHAITGCTLSAGIAIVHHLVPLQLSIERSRAAEREAKRTRNSYAMALHTRSGEERTFAGEWTTADNWHDWYALFREGGLSRGFPYELRELAREFATLGAQPIIGGEHAGQTVVAAEALRILDRKKEAARGISDDREAACKKLTGLLRAVENAAGLEAIALQMIIARFIAQYPKEAF